MKYFLSIFFLISLSLNTYADGIFVPTQKDYPSAVLKNRITDISVEINGVLAETVVYQEFENEWNDTVSGVYSFPLPPDARATRLQYTLGDSLIDATLKVQQQSSNPGTGTGGIISEINSYMGNNALRIELGSIPPRGIKGVRLSYISTLRQYMGRYEYTYPLNTGDFVKHPLDYLKIAIRVNSSKPIKEFDLVSHPDYRLQSNSGLFLELEYLKPKSYTATDISFYYTVENSPFELDLYSWKPDEGDGYFTMVGKPQIESADSSLSQNLIFLLGNSTTMIGNKLKQSKTAISLAIGEMAEADSFNIINFNASVSTWQAKLVPATEANIEDAQQYIQELGTQSGNRMDLGILAALNGLTGTTNSSILVFCDGKSPIDPYAIGNLNTNKTGIYFVAIGDDVDRIRLEAVAAENYGFVSYILEGHVLSNEMLNVFMKIKSPLLKEIGLVFDNPMVHSLFPAKYPAVFAGSDFLVSGKYVDPGLATIEIRGENAEGEIQLTFEKDFDHSNDIGRKIWAKQAIDALEAQILIYGENGSFKDQLIELSLRHNIRCRYTAFTQRDSLNQVEEPGDDPGGSVSLPEFSPSNSNLYMYNYPNPFTELTVLRINVSEADCLKTKVIKIFDASGRLLKTINVSHFEKGLNEIVLYGDELGGINEGVFIVHLMVENSIRASIKMIKAQ